MMRMRECGIAIMRDSLLRACIRDARGTGRTRDHCYVRAYVPRAKGVERDTRAKGVESRGYNRARGILRSSRALKLRF